MVRLIRVTVEMREGAASRRGRIVAPSIARAPELARGGERGREARVLFPIDPEGFFVEGERTAIEVAGLPDTARDGRHVRCAATQRSRE